MEDRKREERRDGEKIGKNNGDGRNGKMAKRNGEKGLYNGKGKITRGGISTVFYCRLKSRLSEGGGGLVRVFVNYTTTGTFGPVEPFLSQ